MLEIVFEEMSNEQYTKLFIQCLKDAGKELSENQLELLADTIEQSRLMGNAPSELAGNLVENWEVIFPQ